MGAQDDNITISKEEYYRLLEVDRFIDALEAAGIDNWEGYSIAYEILEGWNKEDEEVSEMPEGDFEDYCDELLGDGDD